MELFEYFIVPMYFLYMGVSIALAIYGVIKHRKKQKDKVIYARNLLIFAVVAVGVQILQDYILRIDADYLMTSFSWAVGFVFFSTYVNTERFVKSRERISAVESDLAVAANIQLGALPAVENALSSHPDISVFASMTTAKEVGGDFYDFFEVDDSHVCFVIADVSGKGVPAALFMMVVKTMIRDHAFMKLSTAEIFNDVNRLLCENNTEEMFATAWIGILDTKTRIMKCTNAGHNAVCFAKKEGKFEFLRQRHGVFLAGFDFTQYKEDEIQFESGDCLFLYTDGLTEAHNVSAELYGEKRLLEILNSAETRGGEEFLRQIADDVNAFAADTEPFDDLTMMVVKMN
jgi:serine phosphatase RsbU (regulator of sigma subunit)